MEFLSKDIPSVKERFERLRSKLTAERSVISRETEDVPVVSKHGRQNKVSKSFKHENSTRSSSRKSSSNDNSLKIKKEDQSESSKEEFFLKCIKTHEFSSKCCKTQDFTTELRKIKKRKMRVLSDSDSSIEAFTHTKIRPGEKPSKTAAVKSHVKVKGSKIHPIEHNNNKTGHTDVITKKSSPKKMNLVADRMKKLREVIQENKGPSATKQTKSPKKLDPVKGLATSKPKFKLKKPQKPSCSAIVSPPITSKTKVMETYKIPKKPEVKPVQLEPPPLATEELGEEAMDIDPPSSPDPPSTDTVEAMDWEVNEFRKDVVDSDKPFLSDAVQKTSDSSWQSMTQGGHFVLVIDTNVYISSLPFVERLLDINVQGFGIPVLYVPHRVLCELDAIKDDIRRKEKNPQLSKSARQAVSFLNRRLRERHPRVKGQTLKNYMLMDDLVIQDADDKILLSCLQVKNAQPEKRIVLLSNDTNLRSKAILEDLETFSAAEFEKNILNTSKEDKVIDMKKSLLEFRTMTVLKSVLLEIFDGEFGSCKRHMTLENVIDTFIQHWNEKFAQFLPVPAEEHLQRLKQLFPLESNGNGGNLTKLIVCCKMFLTHFYLKGKPYFNRVKKALAAFDKLNDKSLALYGPPIEEKYYFGALETNLSNCWQALECEITKINVLKNAGDSSFESRTECVIEIVDKMAKSLKTLLSYNFFEVASSPAVQSLAEALSVCSDGDVNDFVNILQKVAVTVDGRELISKAEAVFRRALENLSQGRRSSFGFI